MDILVILGSFILGFSFSGFLHAILPAYLAIRTAKTLFPFLSIKEDFRFPFLRLYEVGLFSIVVIPVGLLLINLRIDFVFQLPIWAPWVPERFHPMYHYVTIPIMLVMYITKLTSVLVLGWKLKKKSR